MWEGGREGSDDGVTPFTTDLVDDRAPAKLKAGLYDYLHTHTHRKPHTCGVTSIPATLALQVYVQQP